MRFFIPALLILQDVLLLDAQPPTVAPCLAEFALCQSTFSTIPVNGQMVTNPAWVEASEVAALERMKCGTGMMACFEGKEQCDLYSGCAEDATVCQQLSASRAYSRFNHDTCDAYIRCLRVDQPYLCSYMYGTSFLLPGTVITTCDATAICGQIGEADSSCESYTKPECDDDSDCEWHEASQACWEEKLDTKYIFEIVFVVLAALCCIGACICFGYYTAVVRPKQSPPRFDDPYSTGRVDYLTEMGAQPDDDMGAYDDGPIQQQPNMGNAGRGGAIW